MLGAGGYENPNFNVLDEVGIPRESELQPAG